MRAGLSMQQRKGIQAVIIRLPFDINIIKSESLNNSDDNVIGPKLRQYFVVLMRRAA